MDLLIVRDGRHYPVAIKLTTKPGKGDTRNPMALQDTYQRTELVPGLVICAVAKA